MTQLNETFNENSCEIDQDTSIYYFDENWGWIEQLKSIN